VKRPALLLQTEPTWTVHFLTERTDMGIRELRNNGRIDSATPGSWLLAPGSWLLAPGSWLLAPGSWLLAPGSWLLAPGSWLLAPE
jgi:hypothetical protein